MIQDSGVFRPLQEREAALHAHRHAKRILMRRRHEDEACIRRARPGFGNVETVFVDRDRHGHEAVRFHEPPADDMAGLFEPDLFARRAEDALTISTPCRELPTMMIW